MSLCVILTVYNNSFPAIIVFATNFISKIIPGRIESLVTMEQYAIVEFNDGLQMIPSSWITENKKQAYWPTFTSNERFSKAVQKCISKVDSWPLYEIKRILATANTYEKGITKLKKTEFISDINSKSDNEISKKTRKCRAKAVNSSEESLSKEENIVPVPSYSKIPSYSKVQKKNNNMQSNENPVNKIFKSKGVLKQIENENADLPTNTHLKKTSAKTNTHSKKTSVETHNSINNTEYDLNYNIKNTHNPEAFKIDSVNTSMTHFERYIIRKLLDVDFKVSAIHEQQRNMNIKIDNIKNQIQTFGLDDKIKKTDVESDYMELFRVETLEKLQELEQLLINNKINRKALMIQLARIGGTDIKSITFNILRRIMSDSVRSIFSYVDGKKKYPFFDLHLRKIICGAVRIYFPEATEQNISEPIKSWLRHASERSIKKNLNKTKKSLMQEENQSNIEQHANRRLQKENMNKRTESFVQEDNQEADDEDDKTLDELIGPNPF